MNAFNRTAAAAAVYQENAFCLKLRITHVSTMYVDTRIYYRHLDLFSLPVLLYYNDIGNKIMVLLGDNCCHEKFMNCLKKKY